MFVHWGIYSVGEWHEQEEMRRGMSRADYEKFAGRFTAEKASDREVWPGYYTNTHVNNAGKQRLLQRLSDILNLHWTVTILDKRI